MTLFDILKDVTQDKSGDLSNNLEFSSILSSNYIFQRWISMISSYNTELLNETTNKLLYSFNEDTKLLYKFFIMFLDESRYKKVAYIKRPTKVINEKDDKVIKYLSDMHQLSKAEIEILVNEMEIKLDDYYEKVS